MFSGARRLYINRTLNATAGLAGGYVSAYGIIGLATNRGKYYSNQSIHIENPVGVVIPGNSEIVVRGMKNSSDGEGGKSHGTSENVGSQQGSGGGYEESGAVVTGVRPGADTDGEEERRSTAPAHDEMVRSVENATPPPVDPAPCKRVGPVGISPLSVKQDRGDLHLGTSSPLTQQVSSDSPAPVEEFSAADSKDGATNTNSCRYSNECLPCGQESTALCRMDSPAEGIEIVDLRPQSAVHVTACLDDFERQDSGASTDSAADSLRERRIPVVEAQSHQGWDELCAKYQCCLCMDVLAAPIVLNCKCNYSYCSECLARHIAANEGGGPLRRLRSLTRSPSCPHCREEFGGEGAFVRQLDTVIVSEVNELMRINSEDAAGVRAVLQESYDEWNRRRNIHFNGSTDSPKSASQSDSRRSNMNLYQYCYVVSSEIADELSEIVEDSLQGLIRDPAAQAIVGFTGMVVIGLALQRQSWSSSSTSGAPSSRARVQGSSR